MNDIKRINQISYLALEFIFDCYFNGEPNMMTPIPIDYKMKVFGDEFLLVELSRGKDYYDNEAFGATTLVMDIDANIRRIDLNEFSHSLESLIESIDSITHETFDNADRYGEAKPLKDMFD